MSDLETLQAEANQFKDDFQRILQEVHKIIVGQERVVECAVTALLAGGNVLLEGVPGLGKTELVKTLGHVLDLEFRRIQFTPDLMPADIIGTNIMTAGPDGAYRFEFRRGPIFTQLLLADEINRATPKTQSALLETMQEGSVTTGGVTHQLKPPFFVLATQNPIEQEGTYPLPEAQLDRFMFMINVDYPSPEEEILVMKRATMQTLEPVQPILGINHILYLQNTVRQMPVADHVYDYAQQIVGATRAKTEQGLNFCKKWLSWGAGPRAAMNLILAAKAHAILHGQVYVGCENIAAVALPIMRHRMIPNFTAQSEGITSDDITRRLLQEVRPAKGE